MSMFLPEPAAQQAPTTVEINSPIADPTSEDMALMQRVFAAAAKSPTQIPDGFLSYVFDWFQTQRLEIPIGQVFGFAGYTVQFVADNGAGTVTSTSYSDLTSASAGPQLSALPDGRYFILFGAAAGSGVSGTEEALMSVSINGAAASDNDAAQSQSSALVSVARGLTKDLSNGGSNSINLVYKELGGGTGSFSFRWLAALKFANL